MSTPNNEHSYIACKAYGYQGKWKISQIGDNSEDGAYAVCEKCISHPTGGPDWYENCVDLTR